MTGAAMVEAKRPADRLPAGGVDCDLHHPAPTVEQLLPHMEDIWRDLVTSRGIAQFDTIAYPPNAPLSCRPDWRAGDGGLSSDAGRIVAKALDGLGAETGILNNLCGVHMLYDAYMAHGVTRALNDWTRLEWLDRDERLRASIVPPLQDVAAAVREVERCATDRRFLQILLPSAAHMPYGHRMYWPLYAACQHRHASDPRGRGNKLARGDSRARGAPPGAGLCKRAQRSGSVCSGTFVLTAIGPLDGRRVATHWGRLRALAQLYPSITVDPTRFM